MKWFKRFTPEHQSLWMFIKYALNGLIASAVEFAVYALLFFWAFSSLKEIGVNWWILNYEAGEAGGLCTMLSTVISYAIAQVVNFIIQRKSTFKADNNAAASAVMYAALSVFIWFFQIWFMGVLTAAFTDVMGGGLGSMLAKCLNMTLAFAITYPINKFVIMKRSKKQVPATEDEQKGKKAL